jgi:hypothetical protein
LTTQVRQVEAALAENRSESSKTTTVLEQAQKTIEKEELRWGRMMMMMRRRRRMMMTMMMMMMMIMMIMIMIMIMR